MSMIPEVKCRRCGESFSSMRSRCPNCGTRRAAQSGRTPGPTPGNVKGTAAYERAETNTKWQMIFGLILVVDGKCLMMTFFQSLSCFVESLQITLPFLLNISYLRVGIFPFGRLIHKNVTDGGSFDHASSLVRSHFFKLIILSDKSTLPLVSTSNSENSSLLQMTMGTVVS